PEARPSPRLAARARSWARRQLRFFVPPGQEESLARAMVLGDRGGLDERTSEAFRVSGTYHVLALSGAQVALVIGLLIAAARRLDASPAHLAVLGTVAAVAYAAFVGGDVPVVRAALMASVLLVGRALDLRADLANLLRLAPGFLLAYRPSTVWDVGFQLSFGATLALILLAPPLAEGLPRLPGRAEMVFCASLAAQAALFPLLALHFHRLAPAGLLLNMLAVPLASAVLLAGFGVLACAAVLPAPGGRVSCLVHHARRRSSGPGLVLPALGPRVRAPSGLAWAAWLAGLVLITRGRRGRGLAFAAPSFLLVAFLPAPRPVDGRLH